MSKETGMFCAEEPVNKWSIANGVIGFSKELWLNQPNTLK